MNFWRKIMKKTLLILLALILCLSFTFTACNTTENIEFGNGNDDTNGATEGNQATEDTRPAPSGVDKSIAKNSLNKLDLSTIMGNTDKSFEALTDIVAGFDVNIAGTIDGETGSAWIKTAIENGKIYYELGSESEDYTDVEKAFALISSTTIDLFEEIDDTWQLTDTATLEDILDTDEDFINELVNTIKIPELKEEYLTEKNGMLLVSNQYILDVANANIKLLAGGEISEEEKAEGLEYAEEILNSLGFELYIGTGYDKIVKLAVVVTPNAEMVEEIGVKSIKAELTLDDDATYLKSASLKVVPVLEESVNYNPEITATLNTIVVDGEVVGFDLKANLFAGSGYSGDYPMFDYDKDGNCILNGEIVTEYEYTSTMTYSEIVIDAKVDLSKMTTVGAEVAKLNFTYTPTKSFKTTYKENLETYETSVVSVEEVEVEDEISVSANGTIKTTAENVASISGEIVMGEEKVTISGSFSYGTVDFPEIPAEIKSYFN